MMLSQIVSSEARERSMLLHQLLVAHLSPIRVASNNSLIQYYIRWNFYSIYYQVSRFIVELKYLSSIAG